MEHATTRFPDPEGVALPGPSVFISIATVGLTYGYSRRSPCGEPATVKPLRVARGKQEAYLGDSCGYRLAAISPELNGGRSAKELVLKIVQLGPDQGALRNPPL